MSCSTCCPTLLAVSCLVMTTVGQAQTNVWSPTQLAPPKLMPAYVDLDAYELAPASHQFPTPEYASVEPWSWQLLPNGLIYEQYLAGTKESRLATHLVQGKQDNFLFDSWLGTKVGLLRYGNHDPYRPEGLQVDVEGAAQLRLDLTEDKDVRSADFRAGLPISYGVGRHRWKLAYYHLSSHVGDEFLLKNPGFNRLNYSRDAFVLGYAFYATEKLRLYGETGWAFYSEVSEPWEFQFGLDYAPSAPTGLHGSPFFAVNAHLREEVSFGGGFTLQTGWAWRGDESSHMLRMGLQYYNGESYQFSFFDEHEEQIGFGLWYDF